MAFNPTAGLIGTALTQNPLVGVVSGKLFKKKKGGGGRSAGDYGVPDLSDAVLRELASNPGKYGEISGHAVRELQARSAQTRNADIYRRAVESATYGQLGPQFAEGLNRITNRFAGMGPLADSGAFNTTRARLASDIYGRASGQVGGQYADYLGSMMGQRQQYQYQSDLLQQQLKAQKKKWYDYLAQVGGSAAGAYAGSR